VSGAAASAALHAVRVRGAATAADVERIAGIADGVELLVELEADGLVEGTGGHFVLTPRGLERDEEELRARLGKAAVPLAVIYDERFLPLNVRFKTLAATWQEQGEGIELIEEAAALHEDAATVLDDAAVHAPHLKRYGERLDVAMDAFLFGDADALAGAGEGTYHGTWFELHEDLIATLGRSREEEEA
jgi:hypothetical protein